MKERAIIYGLGGCWEDHWEQLAEDYDIICCMDKNPDKIRNAREWEFSLPQNIDRYKFDKLIICSYSIGLREELVLLWDISIDKIYYYLELYQYCSVRPQKNTPCQDNVLTVVIPTYNRKARLERTLALLERQSCRKFKVIILDNASDYDMNEILNSISKEFQDRITVKRNISNIGQCGNLSLSLLQADSGWVWTLADDDIPSVYAVEIILQEIEKNKEAGAIWFLIHDVGRALKRGGERVESLEKLIGSYRKIREEKNINIEGDFIFYSNKVYNIERIKKYMDKVFTYSYTGISYLTVILFMLYWKESDLVISDKRMVCYDLPDGDHWNWMQMALGMSTITDLPIKYASVEDEKDLYEFIMVHWYEVLDDAKRNITQETVKNLKKLYENIYKIYLTDKEKALFLSSLSEMEKVLIKEEKSHEEGGGVGSNGVYRNVACEGNGSK